MSPNRCHRKGYELCLFVTKTTRTYHIRHGSNASVVTIFKTARTHDLKGPRGEILVVLGLVRHDVYPLQGLAKVSVFGTFLASERCRQGREAVKTQVCR